MKKYTYILRIFYFTAKQAYIIPIYILGYIYRYIKGYIGRSSREIECILKKGKGRRGRFFEVIISSGAWPLLLFYFIFLYPLYYTTYNTAHAASGLWRHSPIYMNPSKAA